MLEQRYLYGKDKEEDKKKEALEKLFAMDPIPMWTGADPNKWIA